MRQPTKENMVPAAVVQAITAHAVGMNSLKPALYKLLRVSPHDDHEMSKLFVAYCSIPVERQMAVCLLLDVPLADAKPEGDYGVMVPLKLIEVLRDANEDEWASVAAKLDVVLGTNFEEEYCPEDISDFVSCIEELSRAFHAATPERQKMALEISV